MNSTAAFAALGLAGAKSRRPAERRRPRWRETPGRITAQSANRGTATADADVTAGFKPSAVMRLGALPTALAGAPTGKSETVLVVDSVPLMRGGITNVLRRLGYRVLEASSALEVQRVTGTEKDIRLLILDLSSIEISDLEFVAWFRLSHPEIKVVVAAGSIWELSFYHGVTQEITLLAKPFTPMELARIVRRTLG